MNSTDGICRASACTTPAVIHQKKRRKSDLRRTISIFMR